MHTILPRNTFLEAWIDALAPAFVVRVIVPSVEDVTTEVESTATV
jgi:hypothetical protein